jgi:hypothetical protein
MYFGTVNLESKEQSQRYESRNHSPLVISQQSSKNGYQSKSNSRKISRNAH